MNEKTEKLIRELAEKLGTTAEQLWGVLLKQAPIDSTIKILLIVFFFGLAICLLYIGTKRLNIDDDDFSGGIVMTLGMASILALLIMIASCSVDVITGFLNPEYWALKQILK